MTTEESGHMKTLSFDFLSEQNNVPIKFKVDLFIKNRAIKFRILFDDCLINHRSLEHEQQKRLYNKINEIISNE